MKCSGCGAINPEHARKCSTCAKELAKQTPAGPSDDAHAQPRFATSIESCLNGKLLKIEENMARRRAGLLGGLRARMYRSNSLVFKSELEEVTLLVDKEGHASTSKSRPEKPTFVFTGNPRSIIAMLEGEREGKCVHRSIDVRMGWKDAPDGLSAQIFREMAGEMLTRLLE